MASKSIDENNMAESAIICINRLLPNGTISYRGLTELAEKIRAVSGCGEIDTDYVEQFDDLYVIRVPMSTECERNLIAQGILKPADILEPEFVASGGKKIEFVDDSDLQRSCVVC
jgi:hypothetical protein